MKFYCNSVDFGEGGLPSSSKESKLSRYIVDFITSMRATIVSLGMYPPGSQTIENAVDKVSKNLQNVMELQDSITFAEVNGLLLIDGQQLEERDRKKPPVVDFIGSLLERKIQSLTFQSTTSSEELIAYLVIMSIKPSELKEMKPLPEQLLDKNVRNVQLNERIYVASSQEEQEALDRREALLTKMLADDGNLADIDDSEVQDLLGDRDHLNALLGKMVASHDADDMETSESRDEFVRAKADRLKTVMSNSYYMLQNIESDEQKEVFKDGLAHMIAEQDADVIAQIMLDELKDPTEFSKLGIQEKILDKLDEKKMLGVTGHTVEEVSNIRKQMDALPPEERQKRVGAIKQMVKLIVGGSMKREFFGEITDSLTRAGLLKKEVAEQLKNQASSAKETAVASTTLINQDGSIREEALDKTIRMFEKIPVESIPGVVASLSEVLGEIVFHEDCAMLIQKMAKVIEKEWEFGSLYQSISDFLEKLCKELIFNENYKLAISILAVFKSHSDPDVERNMEQKKRASHAIEMIASDDVNRMLLTVYQHGENDAREAVSELIPVMGQRMLMALIDLLKTSEDRKVRHNILGLLKNMGNVLIETVHSELLNSGNEWFVTRNMIAILAEIGSQEHAEWVMPLLSSTDARVRREAIKTILELDHKNSIETVRTMISDKDIKVRRFVINQLGVFKDIESIPQIAKFIEKRTIAQVEEEESIQLDAAMALGKMNDESVIMPLIGALKKDGMFSKNRTKTPTIRVRVIYSLSNYKSPEVAKAIKACLKDKSQLVKEAAKSMLPAVQD